MTTKRIGVLALQGAFREHRRMLEGLGADTRLVRWPAELDGLDGLVIPGGESTAIAKLLAIHGLYEPLRAAHAAGMAVFGTCAGAILMARDIEGARPDQEPLALMDAPVGLNLTVKRNCGAGYRGVSIAADGTVYPCHMLHRPELAMGNVFDGTLAEALESEVSARCRALDAANFEGCATCRYERICGGGCRARSLFASGSLESPDSYCAMTLEFYDRLGAAMNAAIENKKGGV